MDPILDPAAVKGVAGILGGAVALSIDLPKSRWDMARRMFVAGVCGYVFPGPTMRQLGLPMVNATGEPDLEMILAVGLVWGFVGWFLLSMALRFFTNRQAKDILDAARDIKDTIAGKETKP
jgi:hypothetical protein